MKKWVPKVQQPLRVRSAKSALGTWLIVADGLKDRPDGSPLSIKQFKTQVAAEKALIAAVKAGV